jgi:Protein of unknown function (DUF2490)
MKRCCLLYFLFQYVTGFAQNDRLNDRNNTNWLQSFNTIKLSKKWSLHAEYQWRREQGFKNWQQSLLRVGANYKINDQITAHLGYGWILTYPYGDYPIAAAGTFPEHRLYEQISFRQPLNKWVFTHRFRIEQRWLRRRTGVAEPPDYEWYILHRFRYQFRSQYAFWTKGERQFYGAVADEIFIGAGKNLGVNIFDQNRIFLLLGYKLNKRVSLEAGYFNQTLQQGRRINNQTIMQRNNGLVLSSILQL